MQPESPGPFFFSVSYVSMAMVSVVVVVVVVVAACLWLGGRGLDEGPDLLNMT